jgi:sterol desaturase/sphingolipid hydroxylase (fatty acid hydroxylase superfamily)
VADLLLKIPTLLVVWGSFFLAGIIVYLIAAFASPQSDGRKALSKCFIAGTWSNKSAVTDLMVYSIGKVTGLLHGWAMPIVTLFLAGIVAASIHYIFPTHHLLHPNIWLFFICAMFLMFFSDFSGWLSHLAQHYVPVLWELHKVHHSALFLNPLTARRGHTLGILFDDVAHACIMGLPTGVIIAFFSLNPVEIALLGAVANKFFFVMTLETLQHSHYPINFGVFERVFISPHMHQIHHSSRKEHWDKNFGYIFSLWDWIFKTAYKPQRGEVIVYGIGERETGAYQGLYGVYVLPLIGMWRVITRKSSYGTALPSIDRGYSPAGILWRDAPTAPLSAIEEVAL